MNVALSIALACLVAGCAQNVISEPALPTPGPVEKTQNATPIAPESTLKPDDKAAIAVDCSGLLHGWNNCLLTASNTCGSRSYTVLDRSDQSPPQPEDSAFTRSMHIRCNS